MAVGTYVMFPVRFPRLSHRCRFTSHRDRKPFEGFLAIEKTLFSQSLLPVFARSNGRKTRYHGTRNEDDRPQERYRLSKSKNHRKGRRLFFDFPLRQGPLKMSIVNCRFYARKGAPRLHLKIAFRKTGKK